MIPIDKHDSKAINVLFLDVETTGLDPHEPFAALLQIAIGVGTVTTNRKVLCRWIASWDCKPADGRCLQGMDPFVRDMHKSTGLLDRVMQARRPFIVSQNVIDTIDQFMAREPLYCDSLGKIIVAGNSVHFDLGWLAAKMPSVRARLSHNTVDVSAYKRLFPLIGAAAPKVEMQGVKHDARNDVRHSMAELEAIVRDLHT